MVPRDTRDPADEPVAAGLVLAQADGHEVRDLPDAVAGTRKRVTSTLVSGQ